MPMARKSTFAWAIAAALLSGSAAVCVAQQQSQNSSQPGNTGAMPPAMVRNPQVTAAGNVRNSSLAAIPDDFEFLKLAPGFLVSLDVLDDSDFQGSYRVDQDGDLGLPVIGNVHVAGETVSDARTQIRKKLQSEQILNNPEVNLTVQEYAAPEVTISGEVSAPGKYTLIVPHRLTSVLALAGGLTMIAGNDIQITHTGAEETPTSIHYSKATHPGAADDVMVQPGDTIYVKRAGIVYVLGAVTRPGGYVMQEDGKVTVLEALSMANGTTMPASIGKIFLLRRNADGTGVTIALPLGKMQRGNDADVAMQPTDVLYVPMSKVKATLLNAQAIIASTASASIFATAVY